MDTVRPKLWERLIRTDYPEHVPFVVFILSAFVLMGTVVCIALSCAQWILKNGDMGGGACWALGLALFTLATLAGIGKSFPLPVIPSVNTVETKKEPE